MVEIVRTGYQAATADHRETAVLHAAPGGPWLTANEAAAYLKVKPRTLLLWTRLGKVKGYSLSGARRHVWRYQQHDLDAALLGDVHFQAPSVL